MKFKAVTADIRDELLKLERSFNSQNYKFGLLYCKKGQTENEMFTNVVDNSNKCYERFLNFLGERITLKGWKNYTGGLDVKNESTGDESVYKEFREQRIMFHVSTLLPYYPRDEQQVERKRHLGNDIVVIVFLEPGAQFTPRLMTTQFN
ncbi:GTPase-activating Rap/Ran-GAP domain family protein 3, putative, partial [Acanthamoeba castellanii str. Neff]